VERTTDPAGNKTMSLREAHTQLKVRHGLAVAGSESGSESGSVQIRLSVYTRVYSSVILDAAGCG
jgi:hypothetical protein